MARAFLEHVQTGTPLSDLELASARAVIGKLVRSSDGDTSRIAELAVGWVLRNPTPTPLVKPGYRR